MNRNKGFTLIELLAVIVILGVIMSMSTMIVSNIIQDSKNKAFDNFKLGVEKAAINYTIEFKDMTKYDDTLGIDVSYIKFLNGEAVITFQDLIDAGYYKENTKSPATSCIIPNDSKIHITKNGNNTYTADFNIDAKCQSATTLYQESILNGTSYTGFNSLPDNKYYDLFTTDSNLTACSGGVCYGQALSETAGWYSNVSKFVAAGPYWLARGGYYNSINPGTFTSDSYVGGNKGYFDPYYYYAFRVVMVAA